MDKFIVGQKLYVPHRDLFVEVTRVSPSQTPTLYECVDIGGVEYAFFEGELLSIKAYVKK